MTVLWPVAAITFKEGIRNRAFYGISIFAVLLLGVNFFISSMIPRDIGKVAVDIALSTVSFTGLLLVLFVGINLIAKDLDKRTIYMVLSRPISRSQYIVGKFIGMALLILAAVLFLSLLPSLCFFAQEHIPRLFPSILILLDAFGAGSHFPGASASCFPQLSVLAFASTSFITLVLTVISYIIGHSLTEVKALVENPTAVGIKFPLLPSKP